MLELLLDWISNIILFLGYKGIFFLMVLESVILPLPSELILPFAGYLVSTGELSLVSVVIVATIGSVIGSFILYAIAAHGGRPFLKRWGKYFFVDEEHVEWAETWFRRYGEKTIFLSRLLPFVRIFINIPAGMTKMNKIKFFLYTFAGALLWNLMLVMVGVVLGDEWSTVTQYMAPVEVVIFAVIGTIVAWHIFKRLERRTLPYLLHKGEQFRVKGEEWAKKVHLKRNDSSPRDKGL